MPNVRKKEGPTPPEEATPREVVLTDDEQRGVNLALLKMWYAPRVVRKMHFLRWQFLEHQPGDSLPAPEVVDDEGASSSP